MKKSHPEKSLIGVERKFLPLNKSNFERIYNISIEVHNFERSVLVYHIGTRIILLRKGDGAGVQVVFSLAERTDALHVGVTAKEQLGGAHFGGIV